MNENCVFRQITEQEEEFILLTKAVTESFLKLVSITGIFSSELTGQKLAFVFPQNTPNPPVSRSVHRLQAEEERGAGGRIWNRKLCPSPGVNAL